MGKKLKAKLQRAKDFARNALRTGSPRPTKQPEAEAAPDNTEETREERLEGQQTTAKPDVAEGEDDMAAAEAEAAETGSQTSLKRSAPHDGDDQGEWQVVSKANKKTKKTPRPGKNYPSITVSPNSRLQAKINLHNLRDLALYILADGPGPQWVAVTHRPAFKKVVALMVPGLEEAMFKKDVDFGAYDSRSLDKDGVATSPDDYYPRALKKENLPEVLEVFADMFPLLWPVRAPGDDKHAKLHSPLAAFLTAPLPKDKSSQKSGVKPAKEPQGWKNDRTRITHFIASKEELEDNGYLIHPALLPEGDRRAGFVAPDGWVVTRVNSLEEGVVPESEIESGSVTAGRDILALDCEMCMTGEKEFALTRISLVNWDGEVVLDELVVPDKPITDYVTRFSGITPEMLAPVKTTLRDIQNKLLDLLTPRTILVGHSLESDTKAMQLSHPFIVDTSMLYPHPRGPPLKSSLKWLAQKYLGREIQKGGAEGHNSIEDAKTCLDLVKQKCEKGKLWGASDSQGENLFRRLSRAGTAYKAQGGEEARGGVETGKSSAAIDWGDPSRGAGSAATHHFGCSNDEEVTVNTIRAINGDSDGLEVKGGGVDFVWARMRELEALQGWWNTNRSENTNSDGGPPAAAADDDDDKPPADTTDTAPTKSELEQALARLTERIARIHASLPPCTAFILYSGSGDPREMARLQQLQGQWRKEYNSGVKWDELSVKWTDEEEQALKRAVRTARSGIGFVGVK